MTPKQTAFNFISDIELEGLINNGWTETLDECSDIVELKNDKRNALSIHWLPDFKAGYEKTLPIVNRVYDMSYSLTNKQAEYNETFLYRIMREYSEDKNLDYNQFIDTEEYQLFENDYIDHYNVDYAFLKLSVYITNKDTIVFMLSLNYSFLEGHAYMYDETLAKVEYDLAEIDNIDLDTVEKLLKNY